MIRGRGLALALLPAPALACPEGPVALHAEAFALTPAAEHLPIHTQTDTGLCALVFDGMTVTATACRPGQTAATLTQVRLALSAALQVEARQIERAGQLRRPVARGGGAGRCRIDR